MFFDNVLLYLIKKIYYIKKNKLSSAKRKSAVKRGTKRALRLKKTQKEKPIKQAKALLAKKEEEKKLKETIDKLLQSRVPK